jgi:hypothetical protein
MQTIINDINKQPIERIKEILNTLFKVSKSYTKTMKEDLIKAFQITKASAFVWNWNDYNDEEQFMKRWTEFLFYKISITEPQHISFNLNDFLYIIESLSKNLNTETFQSDLFKFALNQIVDNIQCYSYPFSQFFKTKFEVLKNVKYTFKAFLKELLEKNLEEVSSFLNDLVYVLEEPDSDTLNALRGEIDQLKQKMNVPNSKKELLNLLHKYAEHVESMLPMVFANAAIKYNNNENFSQDPNYESIRSRINNIKLEEGYFAKLIENVSSSIEANEYFINEEDFIMNKETIDTAVYPLIFAELVFFKNVPIFKKVNLNNHYADFVTSLLNDNDFKTLFEKILLSKPVREFFEFERSEYFRYEKFDKDYYFALNDPSILWNSIKLIPMPENIGGATTDMLRIFINIIPKKFYNCNVKKFNDEIQQKVYYYLKLAFKSWLNCCALA